MLDRFLNFVLNSKVEAWVERNTKWFPCERCLDFTMSVGLLVAFFAAFVLACLAWPVVTLASLIPKSDAPWLTRYYLLRTKWFGVKLHYIKQSDHDFHTHPWNGLSLHLRPYTEILWCEPNWISDDPEGYTVSRRRWFCNLVSAHQHHKVIVDKPMWTLFINGPRINEAWVWGDRVKPWRFNEEKVL